MTLMLRGLSLLVCVLAVGLALGSPLGAQEPAPGELVDPVESGKQAFAEGSFPWYDAEQDSLKPLTFWIAPDWKFPEFSWNGLLTMLFYTLLGLAAVLIILMLVNFVRKQKRPPKQAAAPTGPQVLQPNQVEALPFMAQRSRGDLLGEARRHYEAGNFSEAIIYLFSYQLVELDKHALIHLTKGKTNRQYLREAGRVRPLKGLLERTMVTFEDVFFGRRELDRARFEACWNLLPEFEQQLRAAG